MYFSLHDFEYLRKKNIKENEEKDKYINKKGYKNDDCIIYHSSGRLGDFIYQLSVIQENFIETGKKGILYISSTPENFAHGVETAFNDTKEYITSLPYIKEYKIFSNEYYDIDLSKWRTSDVRSNWHDIFKKDYNVEWGTHPWLSSPVTSRFQDITLFHCSISRFPEQINFTELFKDKNMLFITQHPAEHTYFVNKTGINITLYVPESIDEFICAVNSCLLFIGNLSSPLTYAYGLHKKSITLLNNESFISIILGISDSTHIIGLDTILPTTIIS